MYYTEDKIHRTTGSLYFDNISEQERTRYIKETVYDGAKKVHCRRHNYAHVACEHVERARNPSRAALPSTVETWR